MKPRSWAISFRPTPEDEIGTMAVIGNIAIVDTESGQPVGNVGNASISLEVAGAIKLTVEIYPIAILPWKDEYFS